MNNTNFTALSHATTGIKGTLSRLTIAFVLMTSSVFTATFAEARITRIEITSTESPTFEGMTLRSVGAYEKLRGRAYGEVDPADARNALITDVELAPRNANGQVEYSMDIYILKPINLHSGNHKLFVELPNRGNKLWDPFNLSSGDNDPTTAAHAGEAFLMRQGYAIAWNGWDIVATPGDNRLTITVPVATNLDGSTITGPAYEYISFDNNTTLTSNLAHTAANLETSQATLTVRQYLTDPPAPIASDGWEYVNNRRIRLLPAGTAFQQSAIYELTYTARDPLVAGLGLAATRDFASFLRYAIADDVGNPNPLAGHVQHTYSFAASQPARYVNDFQTLGFNEDEDGRRVFDGILNWLGGGSGVAINFRFAQTGRTERNRRDHLYPEANFPFAHPPLTDPFTGKTAGRSVRCTASGTCPKVFEVNSANEYWVKAGSLLHTDPQGNDLPDPENVRFYLLSGVEHTGSGAAPNTTGICQQFLNTTDPNPALRALFIALDQWVTEDVKPPKSEVPRVSKGTAVFSVPQPSGLGVIPQEDLGFPNIPGVTYTGLITVRHLFDFGPQFDNGILSIFPPDFAGPVYPSFVSRVDQDGNEVAGIRLPPVAVPVATTTGWALRRAEFGGNDGCEGSGQLIPFATTKAERLAAGDPRKSLEERYKDHDGYVKKVTKAAQQLEKKRLLLPEDVRRYIDEAQASDVLQ
jgi:Alpha/beta hydrolase domain